jgi:hypothetical protein
MGVELSNQKGENPGVLPTSVGRGFIGHVHQVLGILGDGLSSKPTTGLLESHDSLVQYSILSIPLGHGKAKYTRWWRDNEVFLILLLSNVAT